MIRTSRFYGTGSVLVALSTMLLVGGCGSKGNQAIPPVAPPTVDVALPDGAYATYLAAGEEALQSVGKFESTTRFTPRLKEQFRTAMAKPLATFLRGRSQQSGAVFVASNQLRPDDRLYGLVFVSRALAFEIEAASAAGDHKRAVDLTLAAIKAGCDMSAAGFDDALAGYDIAASARAAVAEHLPTFKASELDRLATESARLLAERTLVQTTIQSEEANLLGGVQSVLEAYEESNWEMLEKAFYKGAQPAVDHLKQMPRADAPAYFKGFSDEARGHVRFALEQSELPTVEREELKHPKDAYRPWWRFANHLFTTVDTFIEADDLFVARTRLLVVSAHALSVLKGTGEVPPNLDALPTEMTVDPYTGKPFPYRAAGRSFRVYSLGPDGRDDSGETDDIGQTPDVTLDRPRL